MNDSGRKYLDLFLWAVLGVIVGTAIFVLFLSEPAAAPEAQPETPPWQDVPDVPDMPIVEALPEVTVTVITYDDCSDCNSTEYLLLLQLEELRPNLAFNITEVDRVASDSPEGAALIEQYDIAMLPGIIISEGAAADEQFTSIWTANVGTLEDDGALVFRNHYPPYYDVAESKVRGLVDAYVIAPLECEYCEDLDGFLDYLGGDAVLVRFSSRASLLENDTEAQELMERYNLTKLPVFIFSDEITAYPIYEEQLGPLMSDEDGWVVLRDVLPPYFDVEAGEEVGLVEVIKLTDASCPECFDTAPLIESLEAQFGLAVVSTTTHDVSSAEGQALVDKYNISLVPTVLISPEASVYPGFEDVWVGMGDSVEADGWYTYRNHESVSFDLVYRDLNAPEEPEPPAEEPAVEPEENETAG